MNKFRMTAILCAAGSSQRMGELNKLLLPFEGKMILNHCVSQLLDTSINELVIVLGYDYDRVFDALEATDARVKIANNTLYRQGHTSSIQCGIKAADPYATAYMICLADMPMITEGYYEDIMKFYKQHYALDKLSIARPLYDNIVGHPVILSSTYKQDIMDCEEREGCRSIIKAAFNHLVMMPTVAKCYIQDTDTLKEYQALIKDHQK